MEYWRHHRGMGERTIGSQNNITGKGIKAYISFPATTREVELRYAISYVSAGQAKLHYEQEVKGRSFQYITENGKQAREQVLSQIQVEGGTTAQKRSFYRVCTCLVSTCRLPSDTR